MGMLGGIGGCSLLQTMRMCMHACMIGTLCFNSHVTRLLRIKSLLNSQAVRLIHRRWPRLGCGCGRCRRRCTSCRPCTEVRAGCDDACSLLCCHCSLGSCSCALLQTQLASTAAAPLCAVLAGSIFTGPPAAVLAAHPLLSISCSCFAMFRRSRAPCGAQLRPGCPPPSFRLCLRSMLNSSVDSFLLFSRRPPVLCGSQLRPGCTHSLFALVAVSSK